MDTGAAYRLTLLALGALLAFAPAELLARGYGFDRQKQRAPERTGRFPASDWERPQRAVLDGFLHAYQPCVLETGDRDYPYRMWFFGWIVDPTNPEYPGCDAIYHARSRDLDHWEVLCRDGSWNVGQPEEWASILFASSDDERLYYNAWHVGDPSVVFRDGVYYMAFSSTSKPFDGPVEGYPSGMMLCVMGATSVDGVHWRKREEPLLIAAADSVFPPAADAARAGDFHRPTLMWDETRRVWRLYFDYYDASVPGNCHMGLAECAGDFRTGRFSVVHPLGEPLLDNWPNPEVVKIDGSYYCFSDPPGYAPGGGPQPSSGWDSRQLRMATSGDGVRWRKREFIPPDPGIAACQVPQAFVCRRNGHRWLYLFYATQIGRRDNGRTYEWLPAGEYNWFYDQIRYMRQRID